MERTLRPLAAAALALCASACHDSDGSDATAFDPFVTNLVVNGTSESTDPVEVDGQEFAFPTGDDAFDDVLPSDDGAVVEQ